MPTRSSDRAGGQRSNINLTHLNLGKLLQSAATPEELRHGYQKLLRSNNVKGEKTTPPIDKVFKSQTSDLIVDK